MVKSISNTQRVDTDIIDINGVEITAPDNVDYNLLLPTDDGNPTQVLSTNGSGVLSWAAGSLGGTVTSVGLVAPTFLTVSGSPVTSSGTLTLSYSGAALPVPNGGTGTTTSTGTGSVVLSTAPTFTGGITVATNSVHVTNGPGIFGWYAQGNQAIAHNTVTGITFASGNFAQQHDGNSAISWTSGAGASYLNKLLYSITAEFKVKLVWTANSTGRRIITIRLNGVDIDQIIETPPNGTYDFYQMTSFYVRIPTLQTVSFTAYQDSGVSLNLIASTYPMGTSVLAIPKS